MIRSNHGTFQTFNCQTVLFFPTILRFSVVLPNKMNTQTDMSRKKKREQNQGNISVLHIHLQQILFGWAGKRCRLSLFRSYICLPCNSRVVITFLFNILDTVLERKLKKEKRQSSIFKKESTTTTYYLRYKI